ncbi:MAG: glycosyltransferase family 9 protein [Dehalococcoidia bacterium]
MLCAVPALRALRAGFPKAKIVLIGLPHAYDVTARFPQYVDKIIEVPGWPGLPEREPDFSRIPAFLAEAVSQWFDLALQMHGSGVITNQLTCLLGANAAYGFHERGQWCPDPQRFLPFLDGERETERLLRLVRHLGIAAEDTSLEFPLTPEEQGTADALAASHGLEPGRYVCLHSGASTPERRWPPERFAAVADALAEAGLTAVITGADEEAAETAAMRKSMRAQAVDLTGQTTLATLAGVVRQARLVVCNDTSVSHIAAALGVPSVVVFTASDPRRWAPADGETHRAVVADPANPAEADSSVLAEALSLLERGHVHAA